MSIYQWFVFFLFIQLVHFQTWKLVAAGVKKLGSRRTCLQCDRFDENNRSNWWTILLFIPII
jgi:signal peptidase I